METGGALKRGMGDGADPGSPARRQRSQHVLVDLAALKALMAEQSETLLAQQRQGMQEMIAELRGEVAKGDEEIHRKLESQGEQLKELTNDKDEILKRLRALECRGPGSAGSTASGGEAPGLDRYKSTLIFGGWNRETPKKQITDEAHKVLGDLNLAQLTDFPTWTTGPRRSMCLLNFLVRRDEGFQGMRGRMQQVLDGVMSAGITLSSGKKLWCSHSRPREERLRGDHAALVRRTVRALRPEKEAELDIEYSSGSSWLQEFKLSSASVPPEGKEKCTMYVAEGQPNGPWIDVTSLAHCLGKTEKAVREAIGEQKR